jgi:1-carboxybiuret hydrolase
LPAPPWISPWPTTPCRGRTPEDPVASSRPAEPVTPLLDRGTDGLRIAVAEGHFARNGGPEAFAAVARVAEALGATRRVTLPEAARARSAAYLITAAEGAALHLDRLRHRAAEFDAAVRDRLLAGALMPAAWVMRAQRFRRWYRDQVLALFEAVDVILAPSTPCRAPALGQKTLVLDGVTLPLRPNLGVFTQPVSFIGMPVAAVPVWPDEALPLGVQVIAPPWREDLALRVAWALEQGGVCRAPVAML